MRRIRRQECCCDGILVFWYGGQRDQVKTKLDYNVGNIHDGRTRVYNGLKKQWVSLSTGEAVKVNVLTNSQFNGRTNISSEVFAQKTSLMRAEFAGQTDRELKEAKRLCRVEGNHRSKYRHTPHIRHSHVTRCVCAALPTAHIRYHNILLAI